MLAEYALVPDIFDTISYSSPELCDTRMQYLKEVLLEEALIRDLHGGGGWSAYIKDWVKEAGDRCPQRSKELLKKLAKQKRLRCVQAVSETPPTNSTDWCREAIASHNIYPLNGVIASRAITEDLQGTECRATLVEVSVQSTLKFTAADHGC